MIVGGAVDHFLQAVVETISSRLVDETSGSQSLGAYAKGSCISSFRLKKTESAKSLPHAIDIWLFLQAAQVLVWLIYI